MRLLLDTHALLWWLEGSRRLARHAVAAIDASENEAHVSAATAWEVVTKVSLGKLRFAGDLSTRLERYDLTPLPISVDHAWAAGTLPPHHRDPFDRILIAQARAEGLTIVTRDPIFGRYGVPVLAA